MNTPTSSSNTEGTFTPEKSEQTQINVVEPTTSERPKAKHGFNINLPLLRPGGVGHFKAFEISMSGFLQSKYVL